MDPNLFHLDWERTFEVVAAVILLAFFVERGLSIVFEHRWFVSNLDRKGFKEPIAFVVALGVCRYWDFDAVSMVILADRTSFLGQFITAGIIAGGSKASLRLFRDVMDLRSRAARAADDAAATAP